MLEGVQGARGQSITQDAYSDFQIRAKKVDLGGKGNLVTGAESPHEALSPRGGCSRCWI